MRMPRSPAALSYLASRPLRWSIRCPARRSTGPTTAPLAASPGARLVSSRSTPGQTKVLGVLIGDLADPSPAVSDRVHGITEGVHESLPTLRLASLDTGGQSVRADALLAKFLQTQRGQRLLIATLDATLPLSMPGMPLK